MMRVRFQANEDDPRPINFPVKHPYWITGYGPDYAIIVSYADDLNYIRKNWPEANNLDILEEEAEYIFTSRFPKPDWFMEHKT